MNKHELIKLLDNTFTDVEFDVFEDIEGLVRVNFVIRDNMTKHELIKLLDSTFHDVEFDTFEGIEGLLRVNFVIDEVENV
tara:strand:+ start:3038 stop:3277 length:240 start_codon:yes stop_codon:yes gene_type:complete